LKEKNNELWRVDYFSFVRLDISGYFGWLTRKNKTKEATYYIDEQEYKTTNINDGCITTERPAANTRLCPPAR
jgi:hypothetical protein